MKTVIITLFFVAIAFSLSAQETETIVALQKKIDSLEQRLDEKNYTRVPNAAIDEELNKKVKDSVGEWFDRNKWINGSIFGGLILIVGIFILTIGRKWMTKELNDKLQNEVATKTKDIKDLFAEHKTSLKEDIKDWKDSMIAKFEELNKNIERFKSESSDNLLRLKQEIYGDIERITQEKFRDLDKSNKEIQAEMNEALDQLFAQTVESITETAQRKGKAVDPKAEEQIKFVLKRLKQGTIQNDTLATQALESIILYYYYILKTDKMIELIKDYKDVYSLSSTIYANAALAFLDLYERYNQDSYKISCLEYSDESIKKTPDYGTAYAIKIEVHLINLVKGYSEKVKEDAKIEIDKILHQVLNMQSVYIHKEIVERLEQDSQHYMAPYIAHLNEFFPNQMKAMYEKANPTPTPKAA